jgi:adenosylcobinamide-GDP ribazoletransferase
MQNDIPRPSDLFAALRLLTRLPLPHDPSPPRAAAAWAWPVAGALVGAVAATAGEYAMLLGPAFAAALVMAVQAMMTGAMHEDGLADTADGLWGGWDKTRRLAIMKDSHIGTYGVMALLLVALARWDALMGLLIGDRWIYIVAVAALSRAPMALMMALMPNARGSGLSAAVGRPSIWPATLGVALSLGLAVYAFGPETAIVVLPMGGGCLILALVARSKIGGQTGDILGAAQQLAEVIGLTMAAYLITDFGY